MFAFSIEADEFDDTSISDYQPYFPTSEKMQESYEALKKLKGKKCNLKYGYSTNDEGIIDSISVVMDPKEYDLAKNFCDGSALYPISDFEKILEIIKEIMRSREEKIMKNDEIKALTTGEVSRYIEQQKQEQAAQNDENTTIAATDKSELPDEIEKTDIEQADSSDEEPAEADAEEEMQEQFAPKLPVITKDSKSVILCEKGDVRLVMIPLYNAQTLIVQNCKIFLAKVNSNLPYIGAGSEMQIAKEKIMTAKDHTVLNILKKFVINFSEDDIKLAFARAKRFLETSPQMLAVNSSLNIIDAYKTVVNRAINRSNDEENTTESRISEGRSYIYDSQEKIVKIRDKYMQKILEDTGYTPITFCKKICMTEVCTGYKILIHQQGRYTFNETKNQRFYELHVIDELMEEKEAQ